MRKIGRGRETAPADASADFVIPGYMKLFTSATDLKWEKTEDAVGEEPPEAADFTIGRTELKPGYEEGPYDPLVIKGIIPLKKPKDVTEPKPAISDLPTNVKQRTLADIWLSNHRSYPEIPITSFKEVDTPLIVEPEPLAEPQPVAETIQTLVVPRPPRFRRSIPRLPSFELGKKAETVGRMFRGLGKLTLVGARVMDPRPQLEKAKQPNTPNWLRSLGEFAARDLNDAMRASSNMGMGLLNPNYLTETKPTTSERLLKLSLTAGALIAASEFKLSAAKNSIESVKEHKLAATAVVGGAIAKGYFINLLESAPKLSRPDIDVARYAKLAVIPLNATIKLSSRSYEKAKSLAKDEKHHETRRKLAIAAVAIGGLAVATAAGVAGYYTFNKTGHTHQPSQEAINHAPAQHTKFQELTLPPVLQVAKDHAVHHAHAAAKHAGHQVEHLKYYGDTIWYHAKASVIDKFPHASQEKIGELTNKYSQLIVRANHIKDTTHMFLGQHFKMPRLR